jgi:hypothetical protein
VAGEFVASLATVILPVTRPALIGAKTIVKAVDCAALRVRGVVIPLALKLTP